MAREPHWKAIVASDIWHDEIVPWLEAEVERMTAVALAAQDERSTQRALGALQAYKRLIEHPIHMIEYQNAQNQEGEYERRSVVAAWGPASGK